LRDGGVDLANVLASPNLAYRLKELAAENRAFGERVEDYLQDIWRETALLETLAENFKTDSPALIEIVLDNSRDVPSGLAQLSLSTLYETILKQEIGVKIVEIQNKKHPYKITMEGATAAAFARAEAGTHLFLSDTQGFVPIEVKTNLVNKPDVVRVYKNCEDPRYVLDFRTGLITADLLTERELRAFILSGLKLPPELQSQ
jgi:hypothetical protein